MPRRIATLLLAATLSTGTIVALAIATAPAKPIAAEVYVKDAGHATPLRGSLVDYDDSGFTLHVGTDDRRLAWTDVTPATAFALRQKTVDRTQAAACLELGRFGWSIGAKEQAQAALRSAVRIDPTLKASADEILASEAGSAALAAAQPATRPSAKELMSSGDAADPTTAPPTTAPPPPVGVPAPTPRQTPDSHVSFQTATPAQAAAAMAAARVQAAGVAETIGVKLSDFETDHFVVFTDWDARENDFLKKNLEGAYAVVAKQFDSDVKSNVFVGKLPVYMLAKYSDFASFAREIDNFGDVNRQTAGYYLGNNLGIGHMAMWKPNATLTGNSSLPEAQRLWAYVLVHEFTHAFLARYRSNEFIPRWLNEGSAEVIAFNQFPYADRRRTARLMALAKVDVLHLFDDANRPTGEFYPVMQSMVEYLAFMNRPGFQKLIDAIKDGTPPEQALESVYHVNYPQFAEQWRKWARARPDNG